MKLNIHQPQFKDFLNHYPALVNGFLSTLIDSPDELLQILNPQEHISDDACLDAFMDVLDQDQKFMVCGDYDADGILSTTMLVRILKKLNKEVGYYIPNRIEEGYGTSLKTVHAAHQKGYETIIMVDNGVVENETHQYCLDHDLTLVIIDHHQISETPYCDVLIHPDVMSPYYEGQCASGLVYTFGQKYGLNDELNTVLGGIGTIGDMMSIKKQNRYLVSLALNLLNNYHFEVIESLLKKPVTYWDAQTIAFQIVPVFNALGRLSDLGNVNTIVQYLMSNNPITIKSFSEQLKNINQQRKNITAAQSQMALRLSNDQDLFQILYSELFHPGIVGIIAGQLSNSLDKPTMILSGEEILKGSVRSNQLDVYTFLSQFKEEYFLSFGGHASACALSMKAEHLSSFTSLVQERILLEEMSEPSLDVLQFEPQLLTKEAVEMLNDFEPFGQGFKLMDVVIEARIIDVRKLGQAGYLLKIMPVGEIKEILYFKQDLEIQNTSFVIRAAGQLQINQRNELSLIASVIELNV